MTGAPDPGFDLLLIVDGARAAELRACLTVLERHRDPRLAVLLRMKHARPAEVLPIARELRRATRACQGPLHVHSHLDVAVAVDADAVQLPARRPAASVWRPQLGRQRVGISCHDAAELARASEDGADFALLSPFAAVPSKGPALGPARFATSSAASRVPVVALGGIGPDNAGQAMAAGARAVACIRSVLAAPDPAEAAARILTVVRAQAPCGPPARFG